MIKTIKLGAKCSDRCHVVLYDENGNQVAETDGYVPQGFGIGGGDYLRLEIDFETGQILNWTKPSNEAVEQIW